VLIGAGCGLIGLASVGWFAADRLVGRLYSERRPWLEQLVSGVMGQPLELGPYRGLRPLGLAAGRSRFVPVPQNPSSVDAEAVEDEMGDIFLAMVNLARHLGVDAEAALRQANRRFEDRFRLMETAAKRDGSHLSEESLARLEERWQAAKRELALSANDQAGSQPLPVPQHAVGVVDLGLRQQGLAARVDVGVDHRHPPLGDGP